MIGEFHESGAHPGAWPAPDGTVHDAVAYAILRRDWQSGTVPLPQWDDEPALP
ncbi:hypothetical protein [Nonomuraea sp. NPDC050691]|uniref:hypothetical protein n=1 Tax=Nonomuraea sp. NPDC050691 TaxID=3155661 RepID=UPI0033D8DD3A